jgi:hypothetical protein
MRRPRQESNLSWRRHKGNNSNLSSENKALVSEAIAGINKFDDDGSFLEKISNMQNDAAVVSGGNASRDEGEQEQKELSDLQPSLEGMSANQVAAEVLKLRLRGKHEEADRLSVSLSLCYAKLLNLQMASNLYLQLDYLGSSSYSCDGKKNTICFNIEKFGLTIELDPFFLLILSF